MTQLVEAIVYKPMREVALDAARTSQCKRLHMTQLVEAIVHKPMQEVAHLTQPVEATVYKSMQ